MKRERAIEKIKKATNAVHARGVSALYLFGSTARDEAGETSDVDVFIDYDRSKKFSLLDLAAVKLILEKELEAHVDILTRNGIDPLIKDGVISEAVRVL